MIDFTGCKVLVNSYEGADFKRKIIYDGDVYMLKFGQKLESDEHKKTTPQNRSCGVLNVTHVQETYVG